MSSSSSASLRSSRTTDAPSRSSTSAIAAPIPRAAPVTSARRPASGAPSPGPTRITCPLTYADRGESRNRSVSSNRPPGSTCTRLTVAPRPISLPSERTKPSRARRPSPSTITLPDGSTRRTVGWKKRCSSTRSAPVASKTSALKRWSAGASGLKTAASSPASATSARTGSSSAVAASAPSAASTRAASAAAEPAPPSSTRPENSPPRSKGTGWGSPTRLATVPATGSRTSCE